jgi:hypothetical protein
MTPIAALASLFLLAQIMSINAAYTKLDATFTRQCPTGMLINILTVYVSGPACPLTLHVYIKKTPGAKLEGGMGKIRIIWIGRANHLHGSAGQSKILNDRI